MGHFPVYNDAKEKQKKLKIMTKFGKKLFSSLHGVVEIISSCSSAKVRIRYKNFYILSFKFCRCWIWRDLRKIVLLLPV
jgi:hypothetical protein